MIPHEDITLLYHDIDIRDADIERYKTGKEMNFPKRSGESDLSTCRWQVVREGLESVDCQ